ncbi:MAG: thrombospondin type 3 repeat-containing protein [Paludibacter sp.]
MKKYLLTILIFIAITGNSTAQITVDQVSRKGLVLPVSNWSLGLKGGGSYFRTRPDVVGWDFSKYNLSTIIGGTLEWTTSPYIGFGIDGSVNIYTQIADYNNDGNVNDNLKGSTKDALLYTSFNLSNIFYSKRSGLWRKISIYGNAGAGAAFYNYDLKINNGSKDSIANKNSLVFMGGLGLECNISKTLALGLEGQYRYYASNGFAHFPLVNRSYTDAITATLGLRYKFCSSNTDKKHVRNIIKYDYISLDQDKDGIIDQLDKCPNTPIGVKISPTGCPWDTDVNRRSDSIYVPVSHWTIGLKGGGSYFRTRSDLTGWNLNDFNYTSVFGGNVEYTISPKIGIGIEGTYNSYKHLQDNSTTDNLVNDYLKGRTLDAVLYTSFNLSNIISSKRKGFFSNLNLYANAGVGMAFFNYEVGDTLKPVSSYGPFTNDTTVKNSPIVMAGLNLEYNINKSLAISLEGQYRYYVSDRMAHFPQQRGFTDALTASLGLKYKFCSKNADKKHVRNIQKFELIAIDADKDGVIDRLDNCPNTPEDAIVDGKGCILDKDGDGVGDNVDNCPETPAAAYGKIEANGCPADTDGDGVPDYLDKCGNTPVEARGFVDAKGCSIDSDGDGVADYLDKCPNTIPESRGMVDIKGCPLDTDGDGVFDYLDKCNNTPPMAYGMINKKGCPIDSDSDGVPDYLDNCNNTPVETRGMVDINGCPMDTDGDGVADYLDKCNNTPIEAKGMVNKKGCLLDSDGDGVADYLDSCKFTPVDARGMVDRKGCPMDTDGDGVADYLDKCPIIPGSMSNNGCPEIKNEVKSLLQQALNGVQFESGKAQIKSSSFELLNKIAIILMQNPTYLVEIQGHTDNVGNPKLNLLLSQNRVEAVRKYLIDTGVDEMRVTSKGFGDTKPIADNKTPLGRSKNRRVEFVVTFSK